jgi:hypothetical protein
VEKGYFGDYGNLALTVDLSTKSLQQNFSGSQPSSSPSPRPSSSASPSGPLPVPLPLPSLSTPAPAPVRPTATKLPLPPLSSRWLPGRTLDDLLLGVLR